jgi:ATP-dependent Clp protease ATP-binding subunit ClpC
MLESEMQKLLQMEERMQMRVIGQDEALGAVANAVRRSRAGLQRENRPVGSFVFLGPTGVGKTEVARSLAEFLFDDEHSMVRIDMSEFMEKHAVSRLVGAPPGYVGFEEGGQLTEKVRRRPYAVVLMDEIEKAHHDIFNLLLQIMEDGKLTDSYGRKVDFRNTILVMTSNVGADLIKNQGSLGFGKKGGDSDNDRLKKSLTEAVEREFRPEFVNRLDEIIIFKYLDRNDLSNIINIEISGVVRRLEDQTMTLELTEDAREFLIDQGYNQDFGARPLRRAIGKFVEDPIAEEILRGRFIPGTKIVVSMKDEHLEFTGIPDVVKAEYFSDAVAEEAKEDEEVVVEKKTKKKPAKEKKSEEE